MKITSSLLDLIGNTPLLQVEKNIFAKLEFQNPSGSVKDRAAFAMIRDAEKQGKLKKSRLIVEASSGNLGIALAWIGKVKGYRVKIALPQNFSLERRKILKQMGVDLILTSKAGGMKEAMERVEKIAKKEKGWIPHQFENPANPRMHFQTTGKEIWKQMSGKVDVFVAGVGSGGSISGVGKFLKSKNPKIKIFAIEAKESAVLSGKQKGKHKIEGISAGFIPKNFDSKVVDGIIQVSSRDAIATSRKLAKEKGILVGVSSGANFFASQKLAKKFPNKKIVTLFCDSGERYLSTGLFA